MGVLGQVLLDEPLWRTRAAAHEARVDALVGEHLDRRRQGEKHPVHDFLFTYYSFRPAQLRRWTPGFGVVCLTTRDGASSGTRPAPEPVTVDDVTARRDLVEGTHALLVATAGRPANFACFGMHEWAMVYRSDEVRHAAYPLRLGPSATDAVVESHRRGHRSPSSRSVLDQEDMEEARPVRPAHVAALDVRRAASAGDEVDVARRPPGARRPSCPTGTTC